MEDSCQNGRNECAKVKVGVSQRIGPGIGVQRLLMKPGTVTSSQGAKGLKRPLSNRTSLITLHIFRLKLTLASGR